MQKHLPIIGFTISCLICFAGFRLAASHYLTPVVQETEAEAEIQVAKTTLKIQYDSSQESARPKLPIHNSGGKRLIVRTREAHCDCFLREASIIVAPGDTKYLPLRFPMHALAYCNQIDLVLVTNDPQQPSVPVSVMIENSIPSIPTSAVSVLEQPVQETH